MGGSCREKGTPRPDGCWSIAAFAPTLVPFQPKGKIRLWRTSRCLKQICPQIWCNHSKPVKGLHGGRAKCQKKAAPRSRCRFGSLNSRVHLYVAAQQKITVIGKLQAWFPQNSPRHVLNHFFVCMCGAHLTCQCEEESNNSSVQPQLILRQMIWTLIMLLGPYTSAPDLVCQGINSWLTAFHASNNLIDCVRTVMAISLKIVFSPKLFLCFFFLFSRFHVELASLSFQGRRLQHPPPPDRVCGPGYRDGLQLPLPRSDRLHHRHHGADLQGSEGQVRQRIRTPEPSGHSASVVFPNTEVWFLNSAIRCLQGNTRMGLYCLLAVHFC